MGSPFKLIRSPKTNYDSEYVRPFMRWQESFLTYENASIFPSQGEARVFDFCSGNGLMILRVKNELKVGYAFSGN